MRRTSLARRSLLVLVVACPELDVDGGYDVDAVFIVD